MYLLKLSVIFCIDSGPGSFRSIFKQDWCVQKSDRAPGSGTFV